MKFSGILTKSLKVGTLHADVKGRIKTPTDHGHKYVVTIVDEFSRYVYAESVVKKGEASNVVLYFVKFF